jgi:two-component system sensor histidine kinase UhpB
MHLQELGLSKSVEGLVRDAKGQTPAIEFHVSVDPGLEQADDVVQRTIYRFTQEGLTNALQHAQAMEIQIRCARRDRHVFIEVTDNGVGLPLDYRPGRGITGMRERVRALGGVFSLSREHGVTRVAAELPFEPPA